MSTSAREAISGNVFEMWDDVQPEHFAPVLEYDALSAGAIVRHATTKKIETRDGSRYTLHTFTTRGGNGETFAVWGAAALNERLRALKPGGVIYVAYRGKHPHATDAGKTEHRFVVKMARNAGELANGMKVLEATHRAMDAFIQAETIRQREERAAAARGGTATQSGPQPPAPDDTDYTG